MKVQVAGKGKQPTAADVLQGNSQVLGNAIASIHRRLYGYLRRKLQQNKSMLAT
jgi:hypothetical protein